MNSVSRQTPPVNRPAVRSELLHSLTPPLYRAALAAAQAGEDIYLTQLTDRRPRYRLVGEGPHAGYPQLEAPDGRRNTRYVHCSHFAVDHGTYLALVATAAYASYARLESTRDERFAPLPPELRAGALELREDRARRPDGTYVRDSQPTRRTR